MPTLLTVFNPFLVKTTAIMTVVIILTLIGAYLVSTEKKLNRQTVEQFIGVIRKSIRGLIILEVILTIVEFAKYGLELYIKLI